MSDRRAAGVRASQWMRRAALGAGLLAGSWYALASPQVQRVDVGIGDVLRRWRTPGLDKAVRSTTDLGSAYAVVGIASGLALTGRQPAATDVLGAGFLAWNLAQANKKFVRRVRPYEADGVHRLIRPPAGSSFPSGHAAVGVAVMSVLAERSRNGTGKRLLQALAAYVPLSRIYVGVHYPTDVLGGAGLGLALGSLWRGPIAMTNRAAVALGWRLMAPAMRAIAQGALGPGQRVRLAAAPGPLPDATPRAATPRAAAISAPSTPASSRAFARSR